MSDSDDILAISDPSSADDEKQMEEDSVEIPGKLVDEEVLYNQLQYDPKLPK